MTTGSLDWKSFWDIGSPELAAHIMFELYGGDAPRVAAEAARSARADNRDEDADFWDAARETILAALERRQAAAVHRFPG